MATSCCWAPSWRSRSRRRRSSMAAVTMRARECSTSASCRRTSTRRRAISTARPARTRRWSSSRRTRARSACSDRAERAGRRDGRGCARRVRRELGHKGAPGVGVRLPAGEPVVEGREGSPAAAARSPYRLRLDPAGAEVGEKVVHALLPRPAPRVEGPLDPALHGGPERPEGDRHRQRRRRRGHRAASADEHPAEDDDPAKVAGQQHGQGREDDGRRDHLVDVVQPVPQHSDPDAHGQGDRQQEEGQDGGRARRVAGVVEGRRDDRHREQAGRPARST